MCGFNHSPSLATLKRYLQYLGWPVDLMQVYPPAPAVGRYLQTPLPGTRPPTAGESDKLSSYIVARDTVLDDWSAGLDRWVEAARGAVEAIRLKQGRELKLQMRKTWRWEGE